MTAMPIFLRVDEPSAPRSERSLRHAVASDIMLLEQEPQADVFSQHFGHTAARKHYGKQRAMLLDRELRYHRELTQYGVLVEAQPAIAKPVQVFVNVAAVARELEWFAVISLVVAVVCLTMDVALRRPYVSVLIVLAAFAASLGLYLTSRKAKAEFVERLAQQVLK